MSLNKHVIANEIFRSDHYFALFFFSRTDVYKDLCRHKYKNKALIYPHRDAVYNFLPDETQYMYINIK